MLIIFDCDGVLRSASWKGLMEAYQALIKSRDKNPNDFFKSLPDFRSWFNHDWRKNMAEIGPPINRENGQKSDAEIFHEAYDKHTALFPWTKPLLFSLRKRHALAVLSSSSSLSVKKSLGRLSFCFRAIIGSDQISAIKPEPDGIKFIVSLIGASTKKTLMLGDSEVDILAGQAAGVKTAAVGWGRLTDWNDLIKLKPNYQFKCPKKLFKF